MAKTKLPDAPKLQEQRAQTVHFGYDLGKNWKWAVTQHFPENNLTNDIALFDLIADAAAEQGLRTVDGHVELIEHKHSDNAKERKAADGSGQKLRRKQPVSFRFYNREGNLLSPSNLVSTPEGDKRADYQKTVGKNHLKRLRHYVPILDAPHEEFKEKALQPSGKPHKEYKAEKRKSLEERLDAMPAEFADMLEHKGINLAAVQTIDVLEHGRYIAEGKYGALLWMLDPGKRRNATNWFKEQAAQNSLPPDVRRAWAYFAQGKADEAEIALLSAYRLQARVEPGIAGDYAEELLWLAKDKSYAAKKAREEYSRSLDLSVQHEPAVFYKGHFPQQEISVENKLQEPMSQADLQGIMNKFPLKEFRQEHNERMLGRYFNDNKELYAGLAGLAELREDKDAYSAKYNRDERKFLNRVLDDIIGSAQNNPERRQNLLRNTSIYAADQQFAKLKRLVRPLLPRKRPKKEPITSEQQKYLDAAKQRRQYLNDAVAEITRDRRKLVREPHERRLSSEWANEFLDKVHARIVNDKRNYEVYSRLINGQAPYEGFVRNRFRKHPELTRKYVTSTRVDRKQLNNWVESLQGKHDLEYALSGKGHKFYFLAEARRRLDEHAQYCRQRGIRIITEKQHEKLFKPALERLEGIFNQELLNYRPK